MKKFFIIALGLFTFMSCKNTSETKVLETHSKVEPAGATTMETEKLALNNNQKWEVNQEMKPYIENGELLVNQFLQEKRTDYKALAQQLKEENNKLIKSCTMDGASHDALHKWLHPHLELVNTLENATEKEKGEELVTKTADSYKTYHQYFN